MVSPNSADFKIERDTNLSSITVLTNSEGEFSEFPQTLQTTRSSFATESCVSSQKLSDMERDKHAEWTKWVLNSPRPPSLWKELVNFVRGVVISYKKKIQNLKEKPLSGFVLVLQTIFPILRLFRTYSLRKFRSDLLAGLTLASLCIPQSIGYATLAKLDPQYGLYTSVVPPLIYAVMGTSREIAIGPVAVVSILMSSLIQNLQDPEANPIAYTKLAFTVTFFAGIFQAAFGLLRLGFIVDFLSHAAIVGFMAGAAIVIGLQQLKGLLGLTNFTNKTDVISVFKVVWGSIHNSWNPINFIIGCSFLSFILITRFLGKRNKKLFWVPAIAPLISVILSTLIVYLTRADENGVKIVKHIKAGLNPISVEMLEFKSSQISEVVKAGLIVAIVALTEAIAVGRSFATTKGYNLDGNKEMVAMGFMNIIGSLTSCYAATAIAVGRSFATTKGYNLDGNKEMVAMGFMNIIGSLTSCYAATGSFSRTAVNFSAGCETVVSNIVMAITVILSLQFFTRLLYYTPTAILASIILSALPGLIDLNEAYHIWKVDKIDFLACIGALFGVLFASVEIGLLVAVMISFARVILNAIQPGIENLGRLPGSDVFCDVNQYPMALKISATITIRIKSSMLCFANAGFVKERILKLVGEREDVEDKENAEGRTRLVVLDMSNLLTIDTSGISALEELRKKLAKRGTELAMANPRWQVIEKLKLANFISKAGGKIFLTVGEAVSSV